MINKITLSGTLLKNGRYFILKTEAFTILVIGYNYKMLEMWTGSEVEIEGSLLKVNSFHLRADKIRPAIASIVPALPKVQKTSEKTTENAVKPEEIKSCIENILKTLR